MNYQYLEDKMLEKIAEAKDYLGTATGAGLGLGLLMSKFRKAAPWIAGGALAAGVTADILRKRRKPQIMKQANTMVDKYVKADANTEHAKAVAAYSVGMGRFELRDLTGAQKKKKAKELVARGLKELAKEPYIAPTQLKRIHTHASLGAIIGAPLGLAASLALAIPKSTPALRGTVNTIGTALGATLGAAGLGLYSQLPAVLERRKKMEIAEHEARERMKDSKYRKNLAAEFVDRYYTT